MHAGAASPSDFGRNEAIVPRSRRSAGEGLASVANCHRVAQYAQRACELFHELGLALANQTIMVERVSGSPDRSPIPRASVIEARAEIRSAFSAVARHLTKELGSEPSNDSVESAAHLICEHADWLAHHSCAARALERLGYVATSPTLWRLAYRNTADWFYVGTCPVPDAKRSAGVCGAKLYQMAGAVMIQCAGCGTEGMIEWWQRAIVGTAQTWVDAYALAAHLSVRWKRQVQPATIRAWARRSSRTGVTASTCLDPSGQTSRMVPVYDDKGRALYDFNAALSYAHRVWGARG